MRSLPTWGIDVGIGLDERDPVLAGAGEQVTALHHALGKGPWGHIWHGDGTSARSPIYLPCLTCTNARGPGWDRTSDLPRVKWKQLREKSVRAGQPVHTWSDWTHWKWWSDPLALFWPYRTIPFHDQNALGVGRQHRIRDSSQDVGAYGAK